MSEIHTGDAFEVLDQLDANSVHAIVTDPPYGLAFMGRSWDDFEPQEYQEWCAEWAGKAMRVLKPGGHMLAFSGNRTHHRLFTGVEDAGYEIRDTITWHYGSGFPKALDVSKAMDKAAGKEGDYGEPKNKRGMTDIKRGHRGTETENEGYQRPWKNDAEAVEKNRRKYTPATDAAKQWDGFKTALKPATEYVVMARKSFDGTVAENVQTHGTGALNIDGARIDAGKEYQYETDAPISTDKSNSGWQRDAHNGVKRSSHEKGRYPANVVFDEQAAERLDREVGELESNDCVAKEFDNETEKYGSGLGTHRTEGYADAGGPSRYFYTSKASKSERTENGSIDNSHPTVKPVDLMEWLVTLVTKENQIVLDPFCGSGTTGKACKAKNRDFIGIEKQPKWADVARVRCGLTPEDPSVVREDDSQQGLEQF